MIFNAYLRSIFVLSGRLSVLAFERGFSAKTLRHVHSRLQAVCSVASAPRS